MTLISLWIPLIATLIALINWIIPDPIPYIDEWMMTFIAGGLWLLYFVDISLTNFVQNIITGDIITITFAVVIGLVGIMLMRRK